MSLETNILGFMGLGLQGDNESIKCLEGMTHQRMHIYILRMNLVNLSLSSAVLEINYHGKCLCFYKYISVESMVTNLVNY